MIKIVTILCMTPLLICVATFQPIAVQGPSVMDLQEELSGMRNLIGELKAEVKDLKEQLEKKSPNETVVKLTNLVGEHERVKVCSHLPHFSQFNGPFFVFQFIYEKRAEWVYYPFCPFFSPSPLTQC